MKNNVKYLRKSENYDLTQQELADLLGVSRATVSAIEGGGSTSDEVVMKISNLFQRDAREIFFVNDVA